MHTSWGFWSNPWLSSSFKSPYPATAFTSRIFHHSSPPATFSVKTTKLRPAERTMSAYKPLLLVQYFLHLFPILASGAWFSCHSLTALTCWVFLSNSLLSSFLYILVFENIPHTSNVLVSTKLTKCCLNPVSASTRNLHCQAFTCQYKSLAASAGQLSYALSWQKGNLCKTSLLSKDSIFPQRISWTEAETGPPP